MARIVRDAMSRPVIFIDPDARVAHAATLMRRRGVHSLVVALEGNRFGIVTTTDIRDKIVAADLDPQHTRVSEIMTTPVATARPEWSLRECSLRMKELGVHHLPVADDRDMIIGMISAIDIFIAVEEAGWGSERKG
jgi:CBS domain-containing protein